MIFSLLCSLSPSLPEYPALFVLEEDRHEWAADLRPGENWVLLPLRAHSERTPRAIPGPRGLELWIAAPSGVALELHAVRVDAISHAKDERILRCGEELWIASDMTLPFQAHRVTDQANRLPQLARLDLQGCANESLMIAAGPPGSDLILIPTESGERSTWHMAARSGEGPAGQQTGLTGSGHALRLDGSMAWELLLESDGLDRAFHANTRAYAPGSASELRLKDVLRIDIDSFEWSRRHARGPLRRSPRTGDAKTERLDPAKLTSQDASVRHVGADELLQLTYETPTGGDPSKTHTLLVRVNVDFARGPRDAAAHRDELPGSVYFRDVTAAAGLSDVHFEGPQEQLDIRPTMGPGAAWGDFDGDGLQDLYVVQGAGREGCEVPQNRLMRNLGGGRFAPVQGASDRGAGMGALFFDLDGDGDLDLYVANRGPDALYRNDGKQGFVDVSTEHELGGDGWSAGLCAADYDRDGDLDLYITSYLVYDTELMPPVSQHPGYSREDPVEMLPFAFPGGKNTFLENVDGQLVDRSEALGLFDEQGRGMQPVFWDFDLDGDQDLYIANDVSMNVLFRNEGDGSFEDISFQTGMDDPRGGMGVTTGDIDFDGDFDLFLTNWELEANALYRNNLILGARRKSHVGTFQDVTVYSRLGRHSVGFTSWGAVLFDADNDMDLDLFVPNGYTSPDYESTSICVGQPNQFFMNDGRGRFRDASAEAGSALAAPFASRAVALCDYDRDGRLDLFVTNNNGPYQLLRNEIPNCGHWLGIELAGQGQNTAAIGARLELRVDGLTLVREASLGGGYLAGHAAELHFGLGDANEIEALSVHWPSGQVTQHMIDVIDQWIIIEEPAPRAEK